MMRKKLHARRNRKIKYQLLLIAMSVILCSSVAFAYMLWKSDVKNTFSPAETQTVVINESFNGRTKKDVSMTVSDKGYSMYVRAAVAVNWVKDDGTICGEAPANGDYSIEYNLSSDSWFQGEDGFYYHVNPVEGGDPTKILIKECKPLVDAPDGYHFNVDIVAQTIQAAGSTDIGDIPAVTDAWGVSVDSNGKLAK